MNVLGSDNTSTPNGSTHCQEFKAEQVEYVFIAKVITSAVAAVMCLVAIFVIVVLRQYRTFVHRLILYLMSVGVYYAVIIGLEIAPIHHNGRAVVVRDGLNDCCAAIAFASQIAVWQFMLFFVWIITYLLVLAVFNYAANNRWQEITGFVISMGIPLVFNWIPLVQDMYGLSGLWCWIKNTEGDCHKGYTLGIVYQYTLFYGPLMLVIAYSFVCFLTIVIKVVRQRRTRKKQALWEALPLLVHPIIYNLIALVMVANRIQYAITTKEGGKPFYPLWFAHALADPMQVLFVPLAFLVHPGTIRQIFKRKHNAKEQTDSHTAYIVSQEYPDSEVDPLVIRGEVGYTRPNRSGYQSILEGNLQLST